MRFNIKQPETKEELKQYFHLRWLILRAPWNQPEGSEIDSIEDECFHIMATDIDNKVIAVARLQFNSKEEAQIRYMAVDETFERNGIGRRLMAAMEQRAKESAHKKIVLDAREPAVDFYKKVGYSIVKKSYLLFDTIQHYQMIKTLNV